MVANGDFIRATVNFALGTDADFAVNTWNFFVTTLSAPQPLQEVGEEIAGSLVSRFYFPVSDKMSSALSINKITLRLFQDQSEGYDGSIVWWVGTDTSGLLPRFVTYSIEMQRENYALRNGRKAYPGPTLGGCTPAGTPGSGVLTAFQNMFDGWEEEPWTVEAGSMDLLLTEVIVRAPENPGDNPSLWGPVASYSMTKYGTQNTRKK